MELENVIELKEAAKILISRDLIELASAEPPSRLRCPPSVGVHPVGDGSYKLAIRVREKSDLPKQTFEKISKKVKDPDHSIDLREIGKVHLGMSQSEFLDNQRSRPLRPGICVGQSGSKGLTGTLGCFVHKRGDTGIYILSNSHVLAQPVNTVGACIVQPSIPHGGILEQDHIANVTDIASPEQGFSQIDAAIAKLLHPEALSISEINGLKGTTESYNIREYRRGYTGNPEQVLKQGWRTGMTIGRVTAFDLDVPIASNNGGSGYMFTDQIEISSVSASERFADMGDSGSLVFDEEGFAIGLLFAVGSSTAYANRIDLVFDHFGLELPR
jgi:hypothetical protein